jgi:fumarylacetoacetase
MPTTLKSFISVSPDSHFPIQNLPYGIFSSKNNSTKRAGTIIGDQVLDLALIEQRGLLKQCYDPSLALFDSTSLNAFVEQPRALQKQVRETLQKLLSADNAVLRDDEALRQAAFHAYADVTMHMPGKIGDYTDFYSSIDHARNTGVLFRDKDNPLLPNYRHIPVGYHGRASSVIPTNRSIKRPHGQVVPKDATDPIFSPSKALDFELEMAFFIGKGNELGEPITIDKTYEHIFGLVVLNDWSARDIQKWEYVPLGPFLSKSFATSISPWIVTLEALEPFHVTPRAQEPTPLSYLQFNKDFSLDIQLEVAIKTTKMIKPEVICRSNFSYLYWTMAQQLAHHTVAGCNTQPMDLIASGTISGPEVGSFGSLLEITFGGAQPLTLSTGETRVYIQDGDEIIMTAFCQGDGYRVGFGEVRGKIVG